MKHSGKIEIIDFLSRLHPTIQASVVFKPTLC